MKISLITDIIWYVMRQYPSPPRFQTAWLLGIKLGPQQWRHLSSLAYWWPFTHPPDVWSRPLRYTRGSLLTLDIGLIFYWGYQTDGNKIRNREIHWLDCYSRKNIAAVISMLSKQSLILAAGIIGFIDCQAIISYGIMNAVYINVRQSNASLKNEKRRVEFNQTSKGCLRA